MSRIVNSTFVSLDGVINHMDRWHFDFVDEESNGIALDQLRASDAMLMGRRTYEIYAGAWSGRDGEYAAGINAIPKYVASTTMRTADWANTTVLTGDLTGAVTELKQSYDRDILMHGYGPVAKALVRDRLLDELCLWLHPMLAGVGTADDMLFSQGLNARFTLRESRPLASGVVLLRYEPA